MGTRAHLLCVTAACRERTSNANAGIGQQIAVGDINSDGILDVCVASKLGVYVYLGH